MSGRVDVQLFEHRGCDCGAVVTLVLSALGGPHDGIVLERGLTPASATQLRDALSAALAKPQPSE